MKDFIESVVKMKNDLDPSKILLFTQSEELMEGLARRIEDTSLIISTQKLPMTDLLDKKHVHMRKLQHGPDVGINVLRQAKDIVLSCVVDGYLDKEDRVLFVISTDVDTILSFDMEQIGIANLKDKVQGRVDLEVLQTAFNIGLTIGREGKEGQPIGALMILGDTNNVLQHTRESVRNPLEGCREEELNILEEENWNTVKEFSMLDGALVIDQNGHPVAAGRYVMFDTEWQAPVEEGLGGRHLAAAYITSMTRAIAIVVSSEGPIRIYKDGEKIYNIDFV